MQLSLSQTPKSISSANYLLRQYGGAAAAYSLQRLDTSTTNVVRARRSTDDAESNFTAEEVSGGSLREFALQNDADLIRFANQAAAADKRMYFDGSNDFVRVSGMTAAADYFGACTIQATVYVEEPSATRVLWSLGSDCYRIYTTGGNWTLNGATNTSVAVTSGLFTVAVDFDSSGQAVELRINGNTEWTGTAPQGISPLTVFDIGARAAGLFWNGLIYDFSISGSAVKNFSFNGYGNTNADWEDQVGSNDGTVFGSPALFSGQGFNAYVTTLYDQSGNGRDATQATAASQPQIVADGVVVTDANGKPAMDFEGTDDYLQFSHSASQPFSIIFVHESDTTLATSNDFFDTLAGGRALIDQSGSDYRLFANLAVGSGIAVDTDPALIFTVFNGASTLLAKNGVSSGTLNAGTSATGSINSIGFSSPSGSYYNGKISEFILYASDQSTSRSVIEANIASRYGITLA